MQIRTLQSRGSCRYENGLKNPRRRMRHVQIDAHIGNNTHRMQAAWQAGVAAWLERMGRQCGDESDGKACKAALAGKVKA